MIRRVKEARRKGRRKKMRDRKRQESSNINRGTRHKKVAKRRRRKERRAQTRVPSALRPPPCDICILLTGAPIRPHGQAGSGDVALRAPLARCSSTLGGK